MLKGQLIHPQILSALGRAGHGSRIVISGGNYPHTTRLGPNAELVFLNLAPGLINAIDVLRTLVTAVPIEAAILQAPLGDGWEEPTIWADYTRILRDAGYGFDVPHMSRFDFLAEAQGPDTCLAIASAEPRLYSSIILTIGVVPPK